MEPFVVRNIQNQMVQVPELEEDRKLNIITYNDFGSTETENRKAEARDGHDVLKTNSTPLVRAEDM